MCGIMGCYIFVLYAAAYIIVTHLFRLVRLVRTLNCSEDHDRHFTTGA